MDQTASFDSLISMLLWVFYQNLLMIISLRNN